MTAPPTEVTATELARGLSDILNRVHYRGERFVVVRNGEPVATIGPTEITKSMTLAELFELLRSLPAPDPDFWNDVEEIHKSQPPVEFREWPS
jgi:prevent-host-death family protein